MEFRGSAENNPAALESPRPRQQLAQGLRIGHVLLLEDASRQPILVVILDHQDRSLHHDRPVVELEIHQVHRTARDLDPVIPRLPLPVQTGMESAKAEVCQPVVCITVTPWNAFGLPRSTRISGLTPPAQLQERTA